ncbi:alpha/beta fold hydrolase [Candidatus Paracaedibacter symbiosus]|uniref:alpha/beta fold hydrolase n=1 Tax=Candidatus Paracaedibacter symbiosus TaxID=244582 RepID=UPI0018DC41F4|nr:alpha/beta hydrolase [Candidatus Paracaedibacter symbiosus]
MIEPKQNALLCLATDGFHKVSYTDWGSLDSQKIAICVHGVSRNGRDFDYLARALAADGYRVICPDMPGRGKSDWLPLALDYNMPLMATILTTFINVFPSDELLWIGTSMGGLLGMLMASRANTPIKKLILNDVGPHLNAEPLKKIVQYLSLMPTFKTRDLAKHFLSQILAPFGVKTDEHLDHLTTYSFFVNDQGEYQLAYDPKILSTFQAEEANLWPFWEPIECPILILRGKNSEILTKETAMKMLEKPHVALAEFEGVAHAPALMDDEQIMTIIQWLKK